MKPSEGGGNDVKISLGSIAHHLLYMDVKLEDVEAKKRCRMRPEHAVHLIPAVLLLCALVLWLFSCNRSSHYLVAEGGVPSGRSEHVVSVEYEVKSFAHAKRMAEQSSDGGNDGELTGEGIWPEES